MQEYAKRCCCCFAVIDGQLELTSNAIFDILLFVAGGGYFSCALISKLMVYVSCTFLLNHFSHDA